MAGTSLVKVLGINNIIVSSTVKRWGIPVASVGVFAIIGVIVFSLSHAATPAVSYEPESGTLANNATTITDTNASAGSAVRFASGVAPLTCNLNATTANFASQVSAATAGQVICLATGSYGTWGGTNKAITITKQSGATPTMDISFGTNDAGFTLDGITIAGGNISGSSSNYAAATNPKNITIKNSTFTAALNIEYITNANILLDRNTHNNIDNDSGCTSAPGRIWFSYGSDIPSGVTIQNSLFDGGNTDGIQAGTGFMAVNNEFRNITEKSANDCAHTDAIQLLGAKGAVIRGNYIHNTADGIVAYDGVDSVLIENNVIDLVDGRYGIELYSDTNSIVRHNTLKYGTGCAYLPCGQIMLDHKTADPAGSGTVIENNIASDISLANGSTAAVNRNNMLRSGASGQNFNGIPVFSGGASPTTYAGFLLSSGSPGKNAGSDGNDVGIN